jgi:hypothetical protein
VFATDEVRSRTELARRFGCWVGRTGKPWLGGVGQHYGPEAGLGGVGQHYGPEAGLGGVGQHYGPSS